MLVLSTKLEDGVQIGDDIRITVIDVRPRNVRLGIVAPQSISIRRDPSPSRSRAQQGKVSAQPRNSRAAMRALTRARASVRGTNGSSDSDTDRLQVLIISRDQPFVSRLTNVLRRDSDTRPKLVTSITEGKRKIAAQQAINPETRHDLVLLDTDLSPRTAVLFLHWLRQSESRRGIPVLAMRSEATPYSTAALLTAGANVVVNRDQSSDRIARCICSAIELWQCAEPETPAESASLQECVA
jgi:carbon storage regulator CsrA